MTYAYPMDLQDRSQRRFMLILLALNLFLAGIIGAFVVRSYFDGPVTGHRGRPAQRIEALSSYLPLEDAAILRSEYSNRSVAIEAAGDSFRQAREKVKSALRAEPYDTDATRRAMAEAGAAHERSEQLFQEVIALAAARMSAEGRRKLSDWPPRQRPLASLADSPLAMYGLSRVQ